MKERIIKDLDLLDSRPFITGYSSRHFRVDTTTLLRLWQKGEVLSLRDRQSTHSSEAEQADEVAESQS